MESGRAYRIRKATIALTSIIAVVFLINSLPDIFGKKVRTFLPIEEQYIEELDRKSVV